ncbi:hypothetical protein NITHO_4210008 [Nitrolancea hollandica Lb]|uniref:Uncharacterized protein n=1 Tax=Nitrolancea hollandica Lb TaxID=1129897 RepID=I4EJR9_9BACT|nr:hypothetical protein NITHO_4210008 [Nitrolancea hollandica Lb]
MPRLEDAFKHVALRLLERAAMTVHGISMPHLTCRTGGGNQASHYRRISSFYPVLQQSINHAPTTATMHAMRDWRTACNVRRRKPTEGGDERCPKRKSDSLALGVWERRWSGGCSPPTTT